MASEAVRYVGKIDCPLCSEDLHVRQNGRDTFNYSCICCGARQYAVINTPAHEIIAGWLRDKQPDKPIQPVASVATGAASKEDAPAATTAKPAPAPAQSIATAIKRGFDLGAL